MLCLFPSFEHPNNSKDSMNIVFKFAFRSPSTIKKNYKIPKFKKFPRFLNIIYT